MIPTVARASAMIQAQHMPVAQFCGFPPGGGLTTSWTRGQRSGLFGAKLSGMGGIALLREEAAGSPWFEGTGDRHGQRVYIGGADTGTSTWAAGVGVAGVGTSRIVALAVDEVPPPLDEVPAPVMAPRKVQTAAHEGVRSRTTTLLLIRKGGTKAGRLKPASCWYSCSVFTRAAWIRVATVF